MTAYPPVSGSQSEMTTCCDGQRSDRGFGMDHSGCALLSRRVVEAVPFEAGTQLYCTCAASGVPMILGECGIFGNRVDALNIAMYMCGEVVCQHLPRPERNRISAPKC